MQVQDEELLNEFRRSRICELCRGEIPGTPREVKKKGRIVVVGGADPHHLLTGHYDVRLNLATLCRFCHRLVHNDVKAKAQIWAVVAKRDGITTDIIMDTIHAIRRDQQVKIWDVAERGPVPLPEVPGVEPAPV